jgi:Kef-type K+ transport system membrane component KefB
MTCPRARRAQISAVVWMFSYPLRTALAVGLSMAQIGEFAFVLLSVASHQGLLAYQVYMLLMGARAAPWRGARRPAQQPRSALHTITLSYTLAGLRLCAPCGLP